jgi:hypothetical protein
MMVACCCVLTWWDVEGQKDERAHVSLFPQDFHAILDGIFQNVLVIFQKALPLNAFALYWVQSMNFRSTNHSSGLSLKEDSVLAA